MKTAWLEISSKRSRCREARYKVLPGYVDGLIERELWSRSEWTTNEAKDEVRNIDHKYAPLSHTDYDFGGKWRAQKVTEEGASWEGEARQDTGADS